MDVYLTANVSSSNSNIQDFRNVLVHQDRVVIFDTIEVINIEDMDISVDTLDLLGEVEVGIVQEV